MTCYRPLTAWRADIDAKTPGGKRPLQFTPSKNHDEILEISCGQCIGCRLKKSKDWAIRCMHEASMHEENCFVTLTFSPESLRKRSNPGSIDKRELQTFFKRLRNHLTRATENKPKIRYFACGEYGEKTQRPHYHALIFGWSPPDKKAWKKAKGGHMLYTSETLEKIWGHGFAPFGDITFDSAGYTAQYTLKKITGEDSREHYTWLDRETGEIRDRAAEFAVMSRRPGIGATWLAQHGSDVYRDDYVVIKGKKHQPPKYYDTLRDRTDPYDMDHTRDQRQLTYLTKEHPDEDRLITMHLAHWLRQSQFIRETDTPDNDSINFHNLRQQSQSVPKAILHAQQRYSFKNATSDPLHRKGS